MTGVVGEIGGPFPMYGFEGCTDIDPDICACATDEDVDCAVCGEEIVPGAPTYARAEGLPWLDPDDVEQEWTTLWWHAACDGRTASGAAPIPCPVCGGAGIVDTSPPGVEKRP